MYHHGVTFISAKVCSPAIFETCFSYDKDIRIAATDHYMSFLHNCAIFIDSYTPVYKFYSFIIFCLLITAVILLLNYLLYIHFLTLLSKFPDLCTVSLLQNIMIVKTISPGCGVRASLMLFCRFCISLEVSLSTISMFCFLELHLLFGSLLGLML